MARQQDSATPDHPSTFETILQVLDDQGREAMSEAIRVLVSEARKL